MNTQEIKYRGMNNKGEWCYGTYHYSSCRKRHYILNLEKFNRINNMLCLHDAEVAYVKQETVGQFIGLKDITGKEIYKDDIIIIGGNIDFPRVIEWRIYGLRVKQINSENNFPLHFPFVGGNGYKTDFEVIGNIHQNPELIINP